MATISELLKESEILKTINKSLSYQISLNEKRIIEIESIVANMADLNDKNKEQHIYNNKWICDSCIKVKNCNLYKSHKEYAPIQICGYWTGVTPY